MASKFIVISTCLAMVNAGIISTPIIATHGLTASVPVATYSSAPSVLSYSKISQATPSKLLTTYSTAPAAQTYAAHPVYTQSYSPSISTVHSAPIAKLAYPSEAQYTTYTSPAVGSTHQSTIRSFDGTISHDSKAIDTAFSSVRKSDTRISNKVYSPVTTNTVSYAAASPAVYHASVATPVLTSKTLSYAAPSYHTVSSAPAYTTNSVSYSAAPATYHSAPATYQSVPSATYQSLPTAYHTAPSATYHTSSSLHGTKSVTYSAAPLVAHVSFDGTNAHYAW